MPPPKRFIADCPIQRRRPAFFDPVRFHQRRFRPLGICTKQARIQAHQGNPGREEPRILSCCEAPLFAAAAAKEKASGLPSRKTKILSIYFGGDSRVIETSELRLAARMERGRGRL